VLTEDFGSSGPVPVFMRDVQYGSLTLIFRNTRLLKSFALHYQPDWTASIAGIKTYTNPQTNRLATALLVQAPHFMSCIISNILHF
jgi:hypothetical protein